MNTLPEVRFTNGELLALIAAAKFTLNHEPRSIYGLRIVQLSQALTKLEAELELRL